MSKEIKTCYGCKNISVNLFEFPCVDCTRNKGSRGDFHESNKTLEQMAKEGETDRNWKRIDSMV